MYALVQLCPVCFYVVLEKQSSHCPCENLLCGELCEDVEQIVAILSMRIELLELLEGES